MKIKKINKKKNKKKKKPKAQSLTDASQLTEDMLKHIRKVWVLGSSLAWYRFYVRTLTRRT